MHYVNSRNNREELLNMFERNFTVRQNLEHLRSELTEALYALDRHLENKGDADKTLFNLMEELIDVGIDIQTVNRQVIFPVFGASREMDLRDKKWQKFAKKVRAAEDIRVRNLPPETEPDPVTHKAVEIFRESLIEAFIKSREEEALTLGCAGAGEAPVDQYEEEQEAVDTTTAPTPEGFVFPNVPVTPKAMVGWGMLFEALAPIFAPMFEDARKNGGTISFQAPEDTCSYCGTYVPEGSGYINMQGDKFCGFDHAVLYRRFRSGR